MQLLEGFIWLGYDWVRILIPVLIALQPIVQSFGNAYFNRQPVFYIPVIIGFLVMAFIRVPKKIDVGPNGHLDWNMRFSSHMAFVFFYLFYYAFMTIPLLWQRPFSRFGALPVFGAVILIWSLYNYNDSGEFSSMWCFLAIGYAFIAYEVNKLREIQRQE
jgi:cytochrome b561